jgi:signal-transduction protein with cAMP-binding, CBS, and nucleotidyltransferase domain
MFDRPIAPRKPPVRVRDVMKKQFDLIDGMATVREALEHMEHIETKILIVKKRHEDDEYGILQIPDIAKLVLAQDRAPERVNVYEIMTKPVVAVNSNMDIRYCARLLAKMHISRAPVMENGEVVGIVSHTDLVMKGMFQQMREADNGA